MPLVSESRVEEPPCPRPVLGEPPARRLSILYTGSLAVVALLFCLSLEIALREIGSQAATIRSLTRDSLEEAVDHGLCLPATLLLSSEAAERAAHAETMARERARWGSEPRLVSLREAAREETAVALPEIEDAEKRLRATLAAATAVIQGATAPSGREAAEANLKPLVATLLREAGAFRQLHREAVESIEKAASARVSEMRWLEYQLFGLVMAVLLLEGLFVISPAVRKLHESLAEMNRSHRALTVYATKLERSNRELQDFASVASHDLQEPLRKVQAFSDRLRTKYAAVVDDQGRDYLDRIQNAAKRMQTLIDDLLTYSRVTTKGQPFVPVDLSIATREVLSDLEVRIERTGGRVEVAELPTIDADPMQVRQLMQNLIGNALKYHRPDVPPLVKVYSRPHLTADAPVPPAPRSSLSAPDFCELLVEDNGIGFEPAYSERIFGIFQRLHGRSEYEGTGVGLAVCRKIVERHGGSVVAQSTPGQGSIFTVTLPVRHKKEAEDDGRAT